MMAIGKEENLVFLAGLNLLVLAHVFIWFLKFILKDHQLFFMQNK
jgi:hypothetical protein